MDSSRFMAIGFQLNLNFGFGGNCNLATCNGAHFRVTYITYCNGSHFCVTPFQIILNLITKLFPIPLHFLFTDHNQIGKVFIQILGNIFNKAKEKQCKDQARQACSLFCISLNKQFARQRHCLDHQGTIQTIKRTTNCNFNIVLEYFVTTDTTLSAHLRF